MEYFNAGRPSVKDESLSVTVDGLVSNNSVVLDVRLPRVVVFVAGDRERAEPTVQIARELYGDRHLAFVCEPSHAAWLTLAPEESLFVIEQPFNPFGREASMLLKVLQVCAIDLCALIVANIGIESFRFRLFALRLRTSRFVLLRDTVPAPSKCMGRGLFAIRTAATLVLRVVVKFPGLDAF